jgi:hypothetical protein
MYFKHGHMARGGHGLPAIPYPSTPCEQPALKRPYGFQDKAGSLRLSSTRLDTQHSTPMTSNERAGPWVIKTARNVKTTRFVPFIIAVSKMLPLLSKFSYGKVFSWSHQGFHVLHALRAASPSHKLATCKGKFRFLVN